MNNSGVGLSLSNSQKNFSGSSRKKITVDIDLVDDIIRDERAPRSPESNVGQTQGLINQWHNKQRARSSGCNPGK